MAVPAFRARTMFAEASGTSMTFAAPSIAAGDCVLTAVQLGSKQTIVVPSAAWKEALPQVIPAIEAWTVGLIYLPNWNEAEHGKEWTVTWGGSSISRHGFISTWSGCDPTNPISAVSNPSGIKECTPASTIATVDAYTTPSNENLLLQFLYNNEGRSATPPTGYTEFADQAAGPAGNYKNAGVEKGEQAKVEITVAKQVTMTAGVALQPPQAASIPGPGSLSLLGVGR